MAFKIDRDEIMVVFQDIQDGKEEELVHRLRRPTNSELIEFAGKKATRATSKGKEFSVEIGAEYLRAAEWLWNKIVQGIEGYVFGDEKELKLDDPKAKELVPLEHKVAAIRKVDRDHTITFDEEKN